MASIGSRGTFRRLKCRNAGKGYRRAPPCRQALLMGQSPNCSGRGCSASCFATYGFGPGLAPKRRHHAKPGPCLDRTRLPLPAIDCSVCTYRTYGIFAGDTRPFEDVAIGAGRSTFAMILDNCVAGRDRGQGIANAFGTPVHWGCNDSVVAACRRIPSSSRGGGERAGARLGARL